MKLVDANVLLYAVNEDALHHDTARGWLDGALSGDASVGFAWLALVAFVRLSTKAGVFPAALPVGRALDVVDAWLSAPTAALVEPTARHPAVLRSVLAAAPAGGNIVNDAHLAALAIEHNAVIVSFDSDFERFDGVRWERPGEPRKP